MNAAVVSSCSVPRAPAPSSASLFGAVTVGGDRSFSELVVADTLAVGSSLTVPAMHTEEMSSAGDHLNFFACNSLDVSAAGNGSLQFANDVTIVAGHDMTLAANHVDFIQIDTFPACAVFCATGDLDVLASNSITVSTPGGQTVASHNVVVEGDLLACDFTCTGNLNINTDNVVLNGNLVTNMLTINEQIDVLGNTSANDVLACNLFCPSGDLILSAATGNVIVVAPQLHVLGGESTVPTTLWTDNASVGNLSFPSNTIQICRFDGRPACPNLQLWAPGAVETSGDLIASGRAYLCDLVCGGALNLNSAQVEVQGNVVANGNAIAQTLEVRDYLQLCTLSCPAGNLRLNAAEVLISAPNQGLDVPGNLTTGGDLEVMGTLFACNIECVGGNALVLDAPASYFVTVGTNLNVPGNVAVVGNASWTSGDVFVCNPVECSASNLVLASTGPNSAVAVQNANLEVSAAPVTVSGNAAVAGTVFACNLNCVASNLLTLNAAWVGIQNANLQVTTGNANVSGNANVVGTARICNVECGASNLTVFSTGGGGVVGSGNLQVLQSGTEVRDAIIPNGTLFACGLDCPGGTLTINANATTTNLTVGGTVQANVLQTATVQVCNVEACAGTINLASAGNVALNNAATVGGLLTTNALSTGGNLSVGDTLSVCRINCTTSANLNVSAPNVSVSTHLSVTKNITAPNLTVTALPAAGGAPLVDYNVSTGRWGYVSDALLANGLTNSKLLGWDSGTSTPARYVQSGLQIANANTAFFGFDPTTAAPSQYVLSQNSPQLVLSRNLTTGNIFWSAVANFPAGTANNHPLLLDPATGTFARSQGYQVLSVGLSATTAFAGATETTVLFDSVRTTAADISYNPLTGVATFLGVHSYFVSINISLNATMGAGGYVALRADGGLELVRSAPSLRTYTWAGLTGNSSGVNPSFVSVVVYSDLANSFLGGASPLDLVTCLYIARAS